MSGEIKNTAKRNRRGRPLGSTKDPLRNRRVYGVPLAEGLLRVFGAALSQRVAYDFAALTFWGHEAIPTEEDIAIAETLGLIAGAMEMTPSETEGLATVAGRSHTLMHWRDKISEPEPGREWLEQKTALIANGLTSQNERDFVGNFLSALDLPA